MIPGRDLLVFLLPEIPFPALNSEMRLFSVKVWSIASRSDRSCRIGSVLVKLSEVTVTCDVHDLSSLR